MNRISSNIALVKEFIDQKISTPGRELNSCDQSSNHNGFLVSAAKRSGFEHRKIGNGDYFYDGATCIGGVRDMKTSLVSSVAVGVSARKHIAKQLFTAAGIRTPRGESFLPTEFEDAAQLFLEQEDPVVVKPASAAAGSGVSVGISSESDFTEAWDVAKSALASGGRILVEELVHGIDVRAFVVDRKTVGAATRVPPFVVGDGIASISELIEESDRQRKRHKYLGRMPIVPSVPTLIEQGFTMGSVPPAGEVVIVNMTVNMHQGGTNMDVTDQLCPELKDLAVRAADAIPGLNIGGIDLMVYNLQTAEGAAVLEVNTAANISVHHLPGYGAPVNVADAIVKALHKSSRSYLILNA